MSETRLLTVKQAALWMNCAVWAIQNFIWSGQLAYVVAGRRFLIDPSDLEKLAVRLKRREKS
ncbi:MAG: hypothetical protein ACLP3K_05670 [Candidatus Acidiferrales bacterium]